LLLAAAGELVEAGKSRQYGDGDPFVAGPWRLGGVTRLVYRGADGEERAVEARRETGRGQAWRLTAGGETSAVEVLYLEDGRIRAAVDERILEGGFTSEGRNTWVSLAPSVWCLERPDAPDVDEALAGTEAGDGANLTAPMPGTVVKVLVGEGDEVEEGQTLLVLEAMKMEQSVAAPHAGTVRALPYAEGARVPGGAVLAELEESGED
jgi:3-methylcrotonyl-CoA carboxylase alpha subunit